MKDREIKILTTLSEVLPNLNELDQARTLGYVEGMAARIEADEKKKEPKSEEVTA